MSEKKILLFEKKNAYLKKKIIITLTPDNVWVFHDCPLTEININTHNCIVH